MADFDYPLPKLCPNCNQEADECDLSCFDEETEMSEPNPMSDTVALTVLATLVGFVTVGLAANWIVALAALTAVLAIAAFRSSR